jgi:hypothetical protein
MTIQDRVGKYLQSGRSWYTRNVNTITKLTVHHDAIPHDTRSADEVMKQIMQTHVNQGWPGMAYHYYIHRDGNIYQVNKHEWVTWHDTRNWDSLGIVVNGYFHPPQNNNPKGQLPTLKFILDNLCTQHPEFPAGFKDVLGHRERSSTACPGDTLFPYVKEYREKLGQVNWGQLPPPLTDRQRLVEIKRIANDGSTADSQIKRVRELTQDI